MPGDQPFMLMDELIHQHGDSINQGGYKNTFGGLIAVGIDVNGKQNGIGQQRDAADGGEQLFVRVQNVKIFAETDGSVENPEIINDHSQQGSKYTQENAES